MANLNWWQRWWMNAWPHRWHVKHHVPRFLKNCPAPFRGEVLEIGAGRGWTSRQILETFPQVELTATDIDATEVRTFEKLRQDYGRRLKMKEENVLKLSFDRDSFDIVLAINTLPHLSSFAVQKAMRELMRVVRPGGLIGISNYGLLPGGTSKDLLKEIVEAEQAEIVFDGGARGYDFWIQKAYPIEKGDSI